MVIWIKYAYRSYSFANPVWNQQTHRLSSGIQSNHRHWSSCHKNLSPAEISAWVSQLHSSSRQPELVCSQCTLERVESKLPNAQNKVVDDDSREKRKKISQKSVNSLMVRPGVSVKIWPKKMVQNSFYATQIRSGAISDIIAFENASREKKKVSQNLVNSLMVSPGFLVRIRPKK